MMIPRCPYCGRPTSFYGLLLSPAPWTRWEFCSACRLFFRSDAEGNFLGLRTAFYQEDPEREWFPPDKWLLPAREEAARPPKEPLAPRRKTGYAGAPGSTIGAWPPAGPGSSFDEKEEQPG
jgi:hypothetical protein